jgi:hypothetical protein
MKITRKTKIRIRKAVAFVRTLCLILFFFFLGLAICSIDGPSLTFPIVNLCVGAVCFGISYALDHLLFETAYKER